MAGFAGAPEGFESPHKRRLIATVGNCAKGRSGLHEVLSALGEGVRIAPNLRFGVPALNVGIGGENMHGDRGKVRNALRMQGKILLVGHFPFDDADHGAHVAADGLKNCFPIFRGAFVSALGASREERGRKQCRAKRANLK